ISIHRDFAWELSMSTHSSKNPGTVLVGGGNKTALLATETITPSTLRNAIKSYSAARELLRSPDVIQSGAGVSELRDLEADKMTLFHLDGEKHRKRRAAVAPYFTLKAINNRYEP